MTPLAGVKATPAKLLYALDIFGVAVFATSGTLAASAAGLDLLGMVIIASITAVGGGTIRDLLLNRHPMFWMSDGTPLVAILLAVAATLAWTRVQPVPTNALLYADALGLAVFAMTGAQLAEAHRCRALVVIFMGTVTGTGGGLMRDVLTAKVPLILRQDIYAVAAMVGIAAYLLLVRFTGRPGSAFAAGLAIIVAVRIWAVHVGAQLPSLRVP